MSDNLHEIPKETLTIKNIKQDIKEIYKSSVDAAVLVAILSLIMVWFAKIFWTEFKIIAIIYGAGGLLLFVTSIIILLHPLIGRKITNKNLVIVEDWLVDINEDLGYASRHQRPHCEFCFAKGGKYSLYYKPYYKENYKWSKMYKMKDQGIYNYSQIDDEFYLVYSNAKKKNILLIYNKKLFDLKEE